MEKKEVVMKNEMVLGYSKSKTRTAVLMLALATFVAVVGRGEYATPEHLKFPYVSTYYVKPTVGVGESVEIGYFVTDWDSSKIRLQDDSFTFDVILEYARTGEPFRTLANRGVRSGDGKFALGALPAGEYTLRIWSVDVRRGLESHRVVHEFRVVTPESQDVSKATYAMTEADLAKYGISNNGATEKPVKVGEPGWQALEDMGRTNLVALQRLIDEKAAAGVRRLVVLPGTYRLSAAGRLEMRDGLTLDLNGATLKLNGFAGHSSHIVRFSSVRDAHLVNGVVEGDRDEHDYKNSSHLSEGVLGIGMGGDCRYCSMSNVVVKNITGYGASTGLGKDGRGDLAFFYGYLVGDWAPGSLDPKTGAVAEDPARFTSAHQKFRAYAKDSKYLQISKYLGYQGCATRSWNLTVCWYGADGAFISGETAYQYRPMLVPDGATTFRVSAEVGSSDEVKKIGLCAVLFRLPWNCSVVNCTFDNCRAVGFAPAAMKNFLIAENEFMRCGQTLAKCALDAEDGWDQMQDVTFRRNRFHDNPYNDLLTCGGHDFVFEENVGDLFLWPRTRSSCVRGNVCKKATFMCDNHIRSGYGRFEGNTISFLNFGSNQYWGFEWDFVLSGLTFEGTPEAKPIINAKATGRFVDCTFRNVKVNPARIARCRFENCEAAYIEAEDWQNVTVSNCTFQNFVKSARFRDCTFTNARFSNFSKGSNVRFENCTFLAGGLLGFPQGRATWTDCTLRGFGVSPSAWQPPGVLTFENCDVTTSPGRPVLTLATYSIGNLGFNKCRIGGEGELVSVNDFRKHPVEGASGCFWMSNCTYSATAPLAVNCRSREFVTSQKEIVLSESGNTFKEGTAFCDKAKLPASWQCRQ